MPMATTHPSLDFARLLTGDEDPVVLVCCLPDKADTGRTAVRRGRLSELLPQLQRFNGSGSGVFLCVNTTVGSRRRTEDIVAVRALFIDSDSGAPAPSTWTVPPTVVTARNERKWHAYWRLAPGEDLRRWKAAMVALKDYYRSDPAVCDLSRVMRLPGFRHLKDPTKPESYRVVTANPDAVYTIDQVLAGHGIDASTVTAEPPPQLHAPTTLDHDITDSERDRLLDELGRLAVVHENDPDRSRDHLVGGWIVEAVRACMPDDEIDVHATSWMHGCGREPQAREISNWIRTARRNLKTGRMAGRLPGVRVDQDFEPTPVAAGHPALVAKTLSADEAGAQSASLVDWTNDIPKTDKGAWRDHQRTVELILEHDPRLVGCFRHNLLTGAIEVRNAPWRSAVTASPFVDEDATLFASWLARAFPDAQPLLRPTTIHTTVAAVVPKRWSYHPVRDYLGALVWDGTPRVDTWMPRHLAAAATAYTAAVGAKTLIAAIARVVDPGCQVDTMCILEGDQGLFKSSAWRALAEPWFSDEELIVGSRDSLLVMRKWWFVEMGELATMRKAEVTQLKAFLTRRADTCRDPYARAAKEHPRQNVFVGSTNQLEYLKDDTGARRFWPVACGVDKPKTWRIDLPALRAERDQLWAEAVHRFKAGERWWLDQDIELLAQGEQEERRIQDPWEEMIVDLLEDPAGLSGFGGGAPKQVTTAQIYQALLPGAAGKMSQDDGRRIGTILRRLGWQRDKKRIEGLKKWAYLRP